MLTSSKKTLLRKFKYLTSLFDFDDEKYQDNIYNTILMGDEFEDQLKIAQLLLVCCAFSDEIEKLIYKYPEFYNNINNSYYPDEISLSEEPNETIFITNLLGDSTKEYILLQKDVGCTKFTRKHNSYFDDETNPDWCLRPSKVSSKEVVLEYRGETKAVLGLDNNLAVIIKKSYGSSLGIVPYKSCSFIFKKDYLDSLNGADPDFDNCVAVFIWDGIDEDANYGLANLTFTSDDLTDEEGTMCIMIALAAHILFRYKIDAMNRTSQMMTLSLNAFALSRISKIR